MGGGGVWGHSDRSGPWQGGGAPRSGSRGTQGRLPHPRIPWAFGQESRGTSHKSRAGLSPGMFRRRKKGPWFRSRTAVSGGAGLSPRRLLKSPAVSLPNGSRRRPGPGAASGCREGASWPQGARGLGWGLRARTLDFARGAAQPGAVGARGPEGPQGAKSTGSSASKDELQHPSCHQRSRLGSCRGSSGGRSRYFDLRPPCRGEGRTLPEAGVANRGGLGLGPVPGARDPRGYRTLRAAAEAGPCWGLAGGQSHCTESAGAERKLGRAPLPCPGLAGRCGRCP